ncbi:MAG: hypothetical protein EPO42_13305 [Gallionellaceae bacterium]|nr:MAG: hypothetical protein EPO42_13305 [Gallionellaceae bacterium]
MRPSVLFARQDSIYKSLDADVWDIERDARNYTDVRPVVAHPPCRAWGRLRQFAKPRPDEKELALFAVAVVRRVGGVLEHPAYSTLWAAAGLPLPGCKPDIFGGWTLPIVQFWFGHRAMKATWLYIVGVSPTGVPRIPLVLGDSPAVIAQNYKRKSPRRPEVTDREREATPPALALWLLEVAHLAKSESCQ